MKVSIWQQFNSNHSSSYTVVGEFQTVEAAQSAYTTIQNIMREAAKWCYDNQEACYGSVEPTPVETISAQQYGFDWKKRVDWLTYGAREMSVSHVERLVVVNTRHVDTWQTGHQFANLFNALNAKVARSVMEGREPDGQSDIWMGMSFEFTCNVSSLDVAQNLTTTLQNIIAPMKDNHFGEYSVPWLVYHPELTNYTPTQIRSLEQLYLEDSAQAQRLHKLYSSTPTKANIFERVHKLLICASKTIQNIVAGKYRKPLECYRMDIGLSEFHKQWGKIRKLPHQQWVELGKYHNSVKLYSATVSHTDNRLEIKDVWFTDITIGLPAFIRYLEEAGCSNIYYTVHQDST